MISFGLFQIRFSLESEVVSGAARKDGSTFTLEFTNESQSMAVDIDQQS